MLYTAMMHTFCLSAAAICSMCRWDPQTLHRQPANANAPVAAPQSDAIALDLCYPTRSFERKNRQWNTLAGGACAISGAAVIAWIVADHMPPPAPTLAAAPDVTLNANPTDSEHSRSGKVARSTESPVAWDRARGNLKARGFEGTGAAAASKPNASTANARRFVVDNHAASEPAFAVARRTVDKNATVSPRSADRSGIDRVAPSAASAHSARRERDVIINPGTHRVPHASIRSLDSEPRYGRRSHWDARRHAASGSLHPVRPRPSMAGVYSPFAPSPRANSDYASVTMSAGMRGIAPAAIARGHVDTDSTEWMNHMSQRRVTEIPDHFSK